MSNQFDTPTRIILPDVALSEFDSDRRVTLPEIADRYKRSLRTMYRWLNDPEIAFPQPVTIRKHHYFRMRDIVAWEQKRAAGLGIQPQEQIAA